MISVRLNKDLEQRLNETSDLLKISRSTFIKEAIESYITDKIDYLDAVKALSETKTTYPLETVLKEFRDEL